MAQVSLKQLSHNPPNAKRRVGKGGWVKKWSEKHGTEENKSRFNWLVAAPDDLGSNCTSRQKAFAGNNPSSMDRPGHGGNVAFHLTANGQ
jgi:hypothetical protein